MIQVGSTIGSYRLVTLLGEGGMARVFLGEHPIIRIQVAVKVIKPEAAMSPKIVDRFALEAMAVGRIDHPNVVRVQDCARTPEGDAYLVMEYVNGKTLAHQQPAGGRFSVARAVAITHQILDGLAAAHAEGIVHRDVKPSNLFLLQRADGSDWVKVMDFGLAKFSEHAMLTRHARLTEIGSLLGTPLYMAPEQCEGRTDVDARADQYGVGCTLYWMLTGETLFPGEESIGAVLLQHMTAPVPSARARNTLVSPELDAVLKRCLAKRREDRYSSVIEMSQALAAAAPEGGPGLSAAPAVEQGALRSGPMRAAPDAPTLLSARQPSARIPVVAPSSPGNMSPQGQGQGQGRTEVLSSAPVLPASGVAKAQQDSLLDGVRARRLPWPWLLLAVSLAGNLYQLQQSRKPEPRPEVKQEPKPEPRPEVKPEPKQEPRPEVKPAPVEVKPEPRPEVKPAEVAGYPAQMAEVEALLSKGKSGAAQACALLRKIEPAYQERPALHEKLGACQVLLEKFQGAEESYAKALKAQPNYPPALFGLAEVADKRGYAVLAAQRYQAYIDAAPGGEYVRLAVRAIARLKAQAEQKGP